MSPVNTSVCISYRQGLQKKNKQKPKNTPQKHTQMSVSPLIVITPAKPSESLISPNTEFILKFPLLSQSYLLTVGQFESGPHEVHTLHLLGCLLSLFLSAVVPPPVLNVTCFLRNRVSCPVECPTF